ncbi:toll-like receptor 2 [Ruditapes philippinarum]|uniref:toll-like receptor 2 n=1 Tax=Ruditapes philippinarum TaxID=129788 RepID=UPI00295B05F9|nr:toll-like receptor 2 [Ruditapes philippinarum]
MMSEMNRHFVGIFVMYMLIVELGNAKTINDQCNEEKNNTVICNNIPKMLSKKYEHVRFVDFKRTDRSNSLNISSFIHESWAKVETIEFNDHTSLGPSCTFSRESFKGLVSLKELKIHVRYIHLDEYAFVGLSSVHTLDVSNCNKLNVQNVLKTLKVKSALPGLKTIIMSAIGSISEIKNRINKKDVDYITPRKITTLDLSHLQMSSVDIGAILKTFHSPSFLLNASSSIIFDILGFCTVQNYLFQIKVLDISHAVLPTSVIPLLPGTYKMKNMVSKFTEVTNNENYLNLKNTFTPSVVNVSGTLPPATSVWIYNCTLIVDEELDWKVKKLIVRNNNLKYLDINFVCPDFKLSSLFYLDFSDNGLEMIRPIKCFPNLEIYVLSNNKLFKMLEKNQHLFEKLLAYHSRLRIINLSNNQLPKIPKESFKYNKGIEIIDLSSNQLEQLDLDLMNLYHLRVLDISYNNIKVLDEISINSLNGVPCVGNHTSFGNGCLVKINSNPFLCSTCDYKSSIQWLVRLKSFSSEQQDLKCTSEDKTVISIDESVTRGIQNICNRKLIIITSTVSISVVFMAVGVICVILHKRKRKLKRKRNMDNVINNLIAGQGQYEFVAFLLYSSGDYQFVEDHVINQLNENLKLNIGTDRNLICTGDQYFRPGFNIHDETELCLDRASVVILLLSNNFCRSSYCRNEFDQAYMQRKPVVLMMLGNVEEELMMPTLKNLYKRDARILWKIENEQVVLNTTWENICSSLLEKVQV